MKQQKIAYLGKNELTDVDLSYLHSAQKLSDITYILEINPRLKNGPAIIFPEVAPRTGVFKALELYPQLKSFDGFIDLDKFYVVNSYGRLWFLRSLLAYTSLLFFLIRQKFSLIHLVWPPQLYEFPVYFLRKRMMMTVHDPFPHEDESHDTLIVRLRRWFAFHLIPKFIILNKAQREKFLDLYQLKGENVYDSKLGSYDYMQTLHTVSHTPSEQGYILFVGKISQYKGVEYLLEAMEQVHEQFPQQKLIVAGGGKFHFDIEPYKQKDNIEFRNRFIHNDELATLIRNSAFLVCPYTNATQSGVIMSAYAFCKPVIATTVGGLPEMLGNGELGPLVPPKDSEALAKAMCKLLGDKESQKNYSENISLVYREGELSWKEIARKLSDIYKQL